MADDKNVNVSITGNSDGVTTAFQNADQTVSKTVASMSDNVEKLSNNFGGITGRLSALGGALTAVKEILNIFLGSINNVVGASIDMADSLGKQADSLAFTTQELSGYQQAAALSDISNQQLEASFKRLNTNVIDAANGVGAGSEAFKALDINVKNMDGTLKTNSQLMGEIANKFQQMPAGANRTAIAMDLFGKSGDKMINMLKGGAAGIGEFQAEAQRMNMVIGPEMAAQSERFNDNVTKMNSAAAGSAVAFTSGLLPALVKITDKINDPAIQERIGAMGRILGELASIIGDVLVTAWDLLASVINGVIDVFTSLWDVVETVYGAISSGIESVFGPSSISKIEFFGNVLKVIRLAFLGVGYAVEVMANFISSALEITAQIVITFAQTAAKALVLDFSGAKEAWSKGMSEINGIVETKAKELADINEKYKGKANEIIFPVAKTEDQAPGGETRTGGTVTKTSTATKTRTSDWAAELDAAKNAYQLQNNLREMDIQEEINYWNARLAQASKGTKEYEEVQKKITDAKIRQLSFANQQAAAIQSIEIERAKNAAMTQLEIDQESARAQLDIGRMSQDEYLAKLREFEERRFAIAKQAIEDRIQLALADPNLSPAERARLNAELEAVQLEHNKNLAKLDADVLRESNAVWEQITNSMASLWDKGLQAMMNGTLTWSNAYKAVLAEVGKVFMDFAGQKAKQWLQTEVLQTTYSKAQGLVRLALEKMGLMQSTAATASSATAKVGANAAVAGSGAASAMASIPYVGPILAIAAMASMLAAVGALSGGIKSARGGYDIPAGLNPMTQLHEQEMVLPKEQAEVIRNMAAGGGAGGSTNITIQALDSESVHRFIMRNSRAVADAARYEARNGGAIES